MDPVASVDETGSSISLTELKKTSFMTGETSRSSRNERVTGVWRMSWVGITGEDKILSKTLEMVPSILCFTYFVPLLVSFDCFLRLFPPTVSSDCVL